MTSGQNIGGLDVLMDEAAPVHLADGRDDADGEAQETSHLHRRAEETAEQLAAGMILEHQNGLTPVSQKLQRPRGPAHPSRSIRAQDALRWPALVVPRLGA